MDALIAAATEAVAGHAALAVLIAFIAAVVEALAVLGVLLPGTPILMAVAGAAVLAGLPMLPLLAAAILGAILGDGISFWLGRRHGSRLRRCWPFATRPTLIGRAEAFFRRFGAVSVALARFVPVLRSTVPLAAGMAGMPLRHFLVANFLSALVWAPAHVYPAQLAALSLGQLAAGNARVALAVGVVLLLTGAGAWGLHRMTARKLLGGIG